MKTDKTKVKRAPQRGQYDSETIFKILDHDFVCQIGFVYEDYPVVIPTIYGRKEHFLYFHGANVSRMLVTMEKGIPISLNVTRTDSIVLARSAMHHSLNYHSVTIFGKACLVEDKQEKMGALRVITEQVLQGRWDEVRQPNTKEINATKVLKLEISEASAKIRTGPPKDEKGDYELDIWAGELPLVRTYGVPIADPQLRHGIDIPASVIKALK